MSDVNEYLKTVNAVTTANVNPATTPFARAIAGVMVLHGLSTDATPKCTECHTTWPCRTINAITVEIGGVA